MRRATSVGFLFLLLSAGQAIGAGTKEAVQSGADLEKGKTVERLHAAEDVRDGKRVVPSDQIKQARNREKDPLVRRRLNEALARTGTPGFQQELARSLSDDPDVFVRQGAAQQLGNYVATPGVVAALAHALAADPEPAVRYACAQSLALSDTPASFNALAKAATDADPNLRRQVAFSLGRHKSAAAKRLRRSLLSDPDPQVRAYAE